MRRSALFHPRVKRILSVLVMLGIVTSALPATTVSVQAAPAALLSFVEVAAPAINCLFDVDCTITVDDLADHFTPPLASGDAFLQSRLWPAGEAGTLGQGLYPYIYRIDMTNAAGLTAASCVTLMRIEFGPIVPMDYDGDGSVEHAFVVTAGGLGNVKPSHMEQFGSTLLVHFDDPPICVGSSQGNGDTSYFFGFASKVPHRDVTADVTGSIGLAETLDAWAPRIDLGVRVRIAESTNKMFKAGFDLPPATLIPIQGPNESQFMQFLLAEVEPGGHEPGVPDVPIVRRLLAVPRGAVARITNVKVGEIEQIQDVLLYPSQPQPVDVRRSQGDDGPPPGVFDDPPFTMKDEAYRSDKSYPEQVVDVEPMGRLRDLDVVQVSIAGGQYNAAKKTLDIFRSVEFEVHFEGGEEGFLPREQADNPFDKSYDGLYAQALNASVLQQYHFGTIVARTCWGYEYLIITHPDLRPAADALRDWKVSRGLSTVVYDRGNAPGQAGDTKEQIRDFIRNKFDTCVVRPTYLLLLGDAELMPTFYMTTGYGESAGTDLEYSLMQGDDIMPDLAYGRIPVDNLEQAQIVIDKIIAYEQTPPFDGSFYNDLSFAAYFQCCRPDVAQDGTASRSFVETSEFVRGTLEGLGYDVQRIYNTSTAYHSNPTKPSYYDSSTRSTTPNRYYNGTLLPADLRSGSGFPWNGDTSDVVDAINEGRFLVLHRDHGWTSGWGDPGFSTDDLAGLSNGALTPVVYSINCASGMFDNETLDPLQQVWAYSNDAAYVSWAEEMLRMEGGAVGIIGDTRVSPTWANSALTRGLFDATWTSVLPAYGGASAIKRLGDILNYGKVYMVSQVGVAQTAGSVFMSDANTDVILYHVLGDPSMKMWTAYPWKIFFPKYYYEIEIPKPWEWHVKYPVEGATLTALQNGNPIARAPIVGGEAILNFIHDADPDADIQLSVQHPDGTGAQLGGPDTHGMVTPNQGGIVTHEPSRFELRFDPGAVGEPTDVLYELLTVPTQELPGDLNALRSFELNAFDEAASDGQPAPVTHFDKPYTMIVGYDESELGGAAMGASVATSQVIDEETLGVHYLDEVDGQWKPLACSVDTANDVVSCQADHFTEFVLAASVEAEGPTLFLPSVSTEP